MANIHTDQISIPMRDEASDSSHPGEITGGNAVRRSSPNRQECPTESRSSGQKNETHTEGAAIPWPSTREILLEEEARGSAHPLLPKIEKLWTIFFYAACTMSGFVDPLYIFHATVDDARTCVHLDTALIRDFMRMRSAYDAFYFVYVILFIWRFGRRWGLKNGGLRFFIRFTIRLIYAFILALPYPQLSQNDALVHWFNALSRYNPFSYHPYLVLLVFAPLQYICRAHILFGLVRQPTRKLGVLPVAILLLPFMIVAHVGGAIWYGLAILQEFACWYSVTTTFSKWILEAPFEYYWDFDCTANLDVNDVNWNTTKVKELCPTRPPNSAVYNFGIFTYALESRVTRSSSLLVKILHTFGFSLRNLCSFGTNLATSQHMLETFYGLVMFAAGLLLFQIYCPKLIEIMRHMNDERKLEQKVNMMRPELDMWMQRHGLSRRLQLKERILEGAKERLGKGLSIDIAEIISSLPTMNRRRAMHLIGLPQLKKVPLFQHMKDAVLKSISQNCRLVTYPCHTLLVQEGEPVMDMLILMRGTAWTFSRASESVEVLEDGGYYAEHVFEWLPRTSLRAVSKSTMSVKAHTRVEALAIDITDLRTIALRHPSEFIKTGDEWEWKCMVMQSVLRQRTAMITAK